MRKRQSTGHTSVDTLPSKSTLLSLPAEVYFTHVFPLLFPDDIVVLGWTHSRLHQLANDNSYWRERIILDLEVPFALRGEMSCCEDPEAPLEDDKGLAETTTPTATIPTTSFPRPAGHFRRLYLGLLYPRVFMWGQWNDRLNLPAHAHTKPSSPYTEHQLVSRPLDVTHIFSRPEGLRDLHCFRSMFVCRDMRGNLRSWGSTAVPIRPALGKVMGAERYNENDTTRRQKRALALGWDALTYISESGDVFQLRERDRLEPSPDNQTELFSPPQHVQLPCVESADQVATYWNDCAALVDGRIYTWNDNALEHTGPTLVDPIPRRARYWRQSSTEPEVRAEWEAKWESEAAKYINHFADGEGGERVVRIALGHDRIIALKLNGEVWYTSFIDTHTDTVWWSFLPLFSSPTNYDISCYEHTLAVHGADPWPVMGWFVPNGVNTVPPYAQWIGPRPTSPVIQLSIGRFHWVALAQDGAVYSWGGSDTTDLGRGNLSVLEEPYHPAGRMPFPPDTRVFSVAHNAALVLGDGRLPAWLGRRFGDEPPITLNGTATLLAPIPTPVKMGFIQRMRHRWREFALLRDAMDY